MMGQEAEAFIRAHTRRTHAPMVPELVLHLASEITPIWQATEAWLAAANVAPPFWAFAWPGSQVLARYIFDHPALVHGRHVLDFAAGCGLAGMAAAQAGAKRVHAAEIDRLAIAAIALNAAENGVQIHGLSADLVGGPCLWDLILCGDVCYEAPMTRHILPWLKSMVASGAEVWIADPGRAYVPHECLALLKTYDVPTSRELEDRAHRLTSLYRLYN
jgi:predicted nicotinamide N-methyase